MLNENNVTSAAAPSTELHIPANFTTHRTAWREALVMALNNAKPKTEDSDEAGYWTHELAAYDRSFDRLLSGELKRNPVQATGPSADHLFELLGKQLDVQNLSSAKRSGTDICDVLRIICSALEKAPAATLAPILALTSS